MQIESSSQKYRENHIILTYICINNNKKTSNARASGTDTTIHINLADPIYKQTFIVDYSKVSKIYNLLVTCSLHKIHSMLIWFTELNIKSQPNWINTFYKVNVISLVPPAWQIWMLTETWFIQNIMRYFFCLEILCLSVWDELFIDLQQL